MKYSFPEGETRLVNSLSKGNILAFNTLFREYGRHLYNFAYAYLKSESEAESLVQDVFLIVWEKRSQLKEELSFKSYLFTISFNIIRKHFRRKACLSRYLNSGIYDEMDLHSSDKIDADSLKSFILEMVNSLPEKRKMIFIKSRFEGLSIKEISEEMNISHKTVENQLTTVLKFLKGKLNNEIHVFILINISLLL